MKKVIVIFVALVFALGVASLGLAADKPAEKPADKCGSCHKGDKALDKVAAKNNIKSAADLTKAVKEGKNKQMHAKVTDDDIKAAAKELKLQ
jgi:hypothetical protein